MITHKLDRRPYTSMKGFETRIICLVISILLCTVSARAGEYFKIPNTISQSHNLQQESRRQLTDIDKSQFVISGTGTNGPLQAFEEYSIQVDTNSVRTFIL